MIESLKYYGGRSSLDFIAGRFRKFNGRNSHLFVMGIDALVGKGVGGGNKPLGQQSTACKSWLTPAALIQVNTLTIVRQQNGLIRI
jgi:hypothetical protein